MNAPDGGLSLNAKEWAVLERLCPARACPRGGVLYWQDEAAHSFFCLRRGRVQIFLTSPDGDERTLSLPEPGAVFGEAAFFDGEPRMSSARALERCEVVEVGGAAFMEAVQCAPGLAMKLLRALARTVRMLSAQVDGMTFLPADRRLARVLAQLCRAGQDLVACTHEELGNLTGASRVTINRALGDFARRGWLRTAYGRVHILNAAALHAYSAGQS